MQVPAGGRRASRALKWQGQGDVGRALPLSATICVSYTAALKLREAMPNEDKLVSLLQDISSHTNVH